MFFGAQSLRDPQFIQNLRVFAKQLSLLVSGVSNTFVSVEQLSMMGFILDHSPLWNIDAFTDSFR